MPRAALGVLLLATGACVIDGPEQLPPPRDAAPADAPHCDPLAVCGAGCADLQNDPMNCGACGVVCKLSPNVRMACMAGRCVP